MTNEDEFSSIRFLADVAVGFIQRDLLSGNEWRVAYALGGVLDSCVAAAEDDYEVSIEDFATELVEEVTRALMYAHMHQVPNGEDIEQQAKSFREMLDMADDLGNNENTTNNEED